MKYAAILLLGAALAFTGCTPTQYTRLEDRQLAEQDSLLPPPMTIQDAIELSTAGVNEDVIIGQMQATQSYFRLSAGNIIDLKKAGVSEKVISSMIQTGASAAYSGRSGRYYYYDGWYYSSWMWRPYYQYYGNAAHYGGSYRGRGYPGGSYRSGGGGRHFGSRR